MIHTIHTLIRDKTFYRPCTLFAIAGNYFVSEWEPFPISP